MGFRGLSAVRLQTAHAALHPTARPQDVQTWCRIGHPSAFRIHRVQGVVSLSYMF